MLIKNFQSFHNYPNIITVGTEPLTHGLLEGTTHFQKVKDLGEACSSGLGFLTEFC